MPKSPIKRLTPEDQSAGQFALEIDKEYMIPLQEIRCPGCGRFLGFQAIVWGAVKIKCTNSKCHQWVTLDVAPNKT